MNTDLARKQRLELGLTQAQIANSLGVAANTYSQYESGKREPDHATVLQLSSILRLPVNALMGGRFVEIFCAQTPSSVSCHAVQFTDQGGWDGVHNQ